MFISYNLVCDSKSCLKSPKRKPHWPISAFFRPAELQSSTKTPRVSNWYIWYHHFKDHENGPSIPNQVWLQQISFLWLGALRVVMQYLIQFHMKLVVFLWVLPNHVYLPDGKASRTVSGLRTQRRCQQPLKEIGERNQWWYLRILAFLFPSVTWKYMEIYKWNSHAEAP